MVEPLPPEDPEDVCFNEANEAWMAQATRLREQRLKAEAAKAREQAQQPDPVKLGGMKKGFLAKAEKPAKPKKEAVPYVAPSQTQPLQMPEVQEAMKASTKWLEEDNSWVTPQLAAALQMNPTLLKGLQDPKVKEALALMQTNPEAAQAKYAKDPEVATFLKEFSGLMATHFTELAKTAPAAKSAAPAAPAAPQAPPITEAPTEKVASSEFGAEVEAALQDPMVQKLIEEVQRGRQFSPQEIAYKHPELWKKLKLLLDNGLLGMQR